MRLSVPEDGRESSACEVPDQQVRLESHDGIEADRLVAARPFHDHDQAAHEPSCKLLGALWEILEYAADGAFDKGSQRSPTLAPIDDTMWDLILDGAGGLIAGVLGPIYMHRSKRNERRMTAFAERVAERGRRPMVRSGDPSGHPPQP